jgi:PII-like signaling protein
MNTSEVTVVRIYVIEGSPLVNQVIHYLQKETQIRGVSVYRAISGFGDSGTHTASIMDMSFSLPLVIEFFDDPKKIEPALTQLSDWIKPGHILVFNAQLLV